MHSWRARQTRPITFLLRGLSSRADAPDPSVSYECQNRFRGFLLPQLPDRGGPWVFPPARSPYILPQPRDLGPLGPAPREQVVAGLFLSSPAPPIPVVICLADLVFHIRADGSMSGQ